jgi:hypothetical protein
VFVSKRLKKKGRGNKERIKREITF